MIEGQKEWYSQRYILINKLDHDWNLVTLFLIALLIALLRRRALAWPGQVFRSRSRVVGITAFCGNSLMMVGTRNGQSGWVSLNNNAMYFLERRRMYLGKWKPYLTKTCSFSWDWSTIRLIQNKIVDFLWPMSCLDRITFSVTCVQRLFVTWLDGLKYLLCKIEMTWSCISKDGNVTVVLCTQRTPFGNRYNKV